MHRGVTNYKTLLEEVRHWRLTSGEDVCIVTFNYDTMIEEALEVVGLKIREIPDYIAHPNYKLFKVHGSVQWVRELDMPFQAYSLDQRMAVHQLIGNAASLNVSNRFKIRAGDFVAARGLENGGRMGVFPAIAIPVVTKDSFECPPDHLAALQTLLPTVKKIITIGWRAKEAHFLDLLRQHPGHRTPVFIVARDAAEGKQIGNEPYQHGVGEAFYYGARLAFVLISKIYKQIR